MVLQGPCHDLGGGGREPVHEDDHGDIRKAGCHAGEGGFVLRFPRLARAPCPGGGQEVPPLQEEVGHAKGFVQVAPRVPPQVQDESPTRLQAPEHRVHLGGGIPRHPVQGDVFHVAEDPLRRHGRDMNLIPADGVGNGLGDPVPGNDDPNRGARFTANATRRVLHRPCLRHLLVDPDDPVTHEEACPLRRGVPEHGGDGDLAAEFGDLDPDARVVSRALLLEGFGLAAGEHRGVGIAEFPDQALDGLLPELLVGVGGKAEVPDHAQGAEEDLGLFRCLDASRGIRATRAPKRGEGRPLGRTLLGLHRGRPRQRRKQKPSQDQQDQGGASTSPTAGPALSDAGRAEEMRGMEPVDHGVHLGIGRVRRMRVVTLRVVGAQAGARACWRGWCDAGGAACHLASPEGRRRPGRRRLLVPRMEFTVITREGTAVPHPRAASPGRIPGDGAPIGPPPTWFTPSRPRPGRLSMLCWSRAPRDPRTVSRIPLPGPGSPIRPSSRLDAARTRPSPGPPWPRCGLDLTCPDLPDLPAHAHCLV
jgi:hypothetical protein